WAMRNNYLWTEAEGVVKFASEEGDNIFIQLDDGKTVVQVRTLNRRPEHTRIAREIPVRIEGVCEATYDENTALMPGLIWVTSENGISFANIAHTNSPVPKSNGPAQVTPNQSATAMG